MKFDLVGQGDNLLLVTLENSESVTCEENAMVMMEGNLDLKGGMKGGFFASASRAFGNNDSFFMETITANRGRGETLLAPTVMGDIEILECGGADNVQYYLNDGVLLACEGTVDIGVKPQSIGRALWGGTGGFFVGKTSGRGKLAVYGFGTVMKMGIDTPRDNPVTIDNNHVVAWDASLHYELSTSTNRNAGFFRNLINSVVSGEGVVTKFSGKGEVVICSRNRNDFVSWLGNVLPGKKG